MPEQQQLPSMAFEHYCEMARVLFAALEVEAYPDDVSAYAKLLEGHDPTLLGRAIMVADKHFPLGKKPAPRRLLQLAESLRGKRAKPTLPPDAGEPQDLPPENAFQKLAQLFVEESREHGWTGGNKPIPQHVHARRARQVLELLSSANSMEMPSGREKVPAHEQTHRGKRALTRRSSLEAIGAVARTYGPSTTTPI